MQKSTRDSDFFPFNQPELLKVIPNYKRDALGKTYKVDQEQAMASSHS